MTAAGDSTIPLASLAIAAVLGVAAIPRALATSRRMRDWYASMARAEGDLRPGPGHFQVMTVGAQATNLGHSSEQKTPSATPRLSSEPVVLQIVGGLQVRLAGGAKLQIASLPGAQRRHLETTTTAHGIANKFSFDVPPGTRFWLECDLALPPGDYRAGGVGDARPIGDAYVVDANQPSAPSLVGFVLVSMFTSGLLGMFVAVMLTTTMSGGCCRGRQSLSPAESTNAAAIAAVFAMIGVHLGIGFAVPAAMKKNGK